MAKQRTIVTTTALTIGTIAVAAGIYYQSKLKDKKEVNNSNVTERQSTSDVASNENSKGETCSNNNSECGETEGCCNEGNDTECNDKETSKILREDSIVICYTSITGTCEKLAEELYQSVLKYQDTNGYKKNIILRKIESIDWWDEYSNFKASWCTLIILLPTYTNGACPPNTTQLVSSLEDISHDWRMEKYPLNGLNVGIWGMGSTQYDIHTFCKPAKELFRLIKALGAHHMIEAGFGDDSDTAWEKNWSTWNHKLISRLFKAQDIPQSVDEELSDSDDESVEPTVEDVEDLLNINEEKKTSSSPSKEMVTPKQAKALKKEGYQLIGTHSAIKLCRWTKHQLRGRGGCYKHTFYGITSYQCMEATPSLACANKCVFCWRHHKNPVAKTWQWKMDEPEFIVKQGIQAHVRQIKQAKGIPGVLPQRFIEAHTVRHCALSLVGEPIMYPKINELLYNLHKRNISTFLVTNGQHPQAIRDLSSPVTQLYVSIDAPEEKTLIEIDRPLFSDAWDRLRESLVALKEKRQRTVARLTIVKGFNEGDIQGYAELISLGICHLVEIKGVTYCGKSSGSNLNMSNSPWHHEIISFAQALLKQLNNIPHMPQYGLACEHKHSCTVLLARKDLFFKNDQWYTWIDYDKFNHLVMKTYEETADAHCFEVSDYIHPTPSWGVFGNEQEGFDPIDTRHYRKQMKYTKFDDDGVPTHDHDGNELSQDEYLRLKNIMEERKREIGGVEKVHHDQKKGEKYMEDVRNMFRGDTLPKK